VASLARLRFRFGCKNKFVVLFFTRLVLIRAQSLTDLGLPVNGSDGIFLQMTGANGWTGDFAPMPEAW
jgi:hypothetical protein